MKAVALLIFCIAFGGCMIVPSSRVDYRDDKVTITGTFWFASEKVESVTGVAMNSRSSSSA